MTIVPELDYSKLKGKLREMGQTQTTLADYLNISEGTLSLRLNSKGVFKQNEMRNICDFLKIPKQEIGLYFFAEKV